MSSQKQVITDCLKELHLPTIRHCYVKEAERAGMDSLSYEDYLQVLMEQEVEERRQNRTARFLRAEAGVRSLMFNVRLSFVATLPKVQPHVL